MAGKGCLWLDGEPRDRKFCGKATVDGTWCAEHRAIVYPPRGSRARAKIEAGINLVASKGGGKGCVHYVDADFSRMGGEKYGALPGKTTVVL